MAARLQDDVMASVRLLAGTDRWVAIDLVAGIAGYVVWVAGSGALGLQVAAMAEYEVAPGGTPTVPVLGLLALLWLLLPAALGVARVRSRLLNLRNNVEQDYRLDRPAALLVPPALVVAILLVAAVAVGTLDPLLFVVLVPATLFLLVRTIAYSYRVYAFSHPVIPYVGLFVTLTGEAAALLLYLGLATENGAIVRATVATLGLPVDPLATTVVATVAVPTGMAAAVAVPIALVGIYLLVQTAAALVVRVREPTIRPRQVRTGQRYPQWLEVASNDGRSSPTSPGAGTTPSSGASASTPGTAASTDAAASDGSSSSGAAPGPTSPDPAGATVDASGRSADDGSEPSTAEAGSGPAAEEAESVSHTRVFTPPDGGGDDPLGATRGDETCPDCGATVPADAEQCPACGAEAA